MIVPFDKAPLLPDWSDQPVLLEAAANEYVRGDDSSNVERGLQAGASLLANRDGVRAILAIGDAETGTLNEAPMVWDAFETVQPVVYTVHVGANGSPEMARNLMRAWSDSNGGVYSYPTTHAETERSFERMSTRLRRPATYALEAAISFVDRNPATLSVVAPVGAPVALAPDVGVEIILDTSGSMREKLAGSQRLAVAKASLRELIGDGLSEGVPMALRTFESTGKSKADRCQTTLSLPFGPLDRAAALDTVKQLKAGKKTKTPIAAAITAAASDLESISGSRTIVLITDGDETCGGDPDLVIEEIGASGVQVNLNIVGFALDDEALKAQMADWAEAGNGSYFDASGAEELVDAIVRAVSAPYRVYARDVEEPVATGTVGDGSVSLEPGAYRVEILTDPVVEFEDLTAHGQ